MRLRPCFLLSLGLLVACADDSVGADELGDMDMDGGSGTDGGDGPTSGEGDWGETGGDDEGTQPAEPFEPFAESEWARGGIRIDRVEANQGTAITIVANGELIPVDQRAGGLVKDRNTLIQAYWSVPGDWQARPIRAELHLVGPDGEHRIVETSKTVEGSAQPGSLTGPLTFQVPASRFVGELEFFIELYEGEGGHDGIAASTVSPSAPAGGLQPIGVTAEPMEAKIVMVPVHYTSGSCNTDTRQALENNLQAFADHYFVQNPVHDLHIRIHEETIEQDTKLETLSQINNRLQTLRFNDFAEPNEYYFGLVDACSGGVDGAGGLAPGTPGPVKGLGDLRVSTGLWINLNFAKETFVHEIGHNQGRPHSPCGGPDGPDPNYPHDNAALGVYGFNILTGQFYPPTNRRDYMSYCSPTWVSDWTWGWIHEQVRQLTSWDYEDSSGGEAFVEVLHGWVHPSGRESWWTTAGELPDEMLSTAESVAFYDDEGVLIQDMPAASWVLEDGKTRYFMAKVPDSELELVAEVVRVSKDVETAVPRAAIERRYDAAHAYAY